MKEKVHDDNYSTKPKVKIEEEAWSWRFLKSEHLETEVRPIITISRKFDGIFLLGEPLTETAHPGQPL